MAAPPRDHGGADVALTQSTRSEPERLKLFSAGGLAVGVVAIGVNARGIVAVGVNAVGVVAIGVNAVGALVALGGNCAAPIGVSLINTLGIAAWSAVNAIGGVGHGLVNSLVHPWLAVPLLAAAIWAWRRWPGLWRSAALDVPVVPLGELMAGSRAPRWARARLLATAADHVIVGDADGQLTLEASGDLLRDAETIGARREARVLVQVEVEREASPDERAAYRASAPQVAVARLVGLRALPPAVRWPANGAELTWVLARTALAASVVATAACLVIAIAS